MQHKFLVSLTSADSPLRRGELCIKKKRGGGGSTVEGGVCLAPWALGVPHDRVVGSSSRGFPELSGQSFCLNPLGQTAGNILSFSSVSAFFLPSLPPPPPTVVSQREKQVLQLCSNRLQPPLALPEGWCWPPTRLVPAASAATPLTPLPPPMPNPPTFGCTHECISRVSWCAVERCFSLVTHV